ncbi:MAG: hypothetical protein JWQ11_3172, partial [Rhizobacter sp.]|nr:hypothetical protein [Rhizobacter sp.]
MPHPDSVGHLWAARHSLITADQRELVEAYAKATSSSATPAQKAALVAALDQRRAEHDAATITVPDRPCATERSATVDEFLGHLEAGRLPLDDDYGMAMFAFGRELTKLQRRLLHEYIKTTAMGTTAPGPVALGDELCRKWNASAVPVAVAVDARLDRARGESVVAALELGKMPHINDKASIDAADSLDLTDTQRKLLSRFSEAMNSKMGQREVDEFNNLLALQAAAKAGLVASDSRSTQLQDHEIKRAVTAFKSMTSEEAPAAIGTSRGPRFELPVRNSADAAMLLFRSVGPGAAAAG